MSNILRKLEDEEDDANLAHLHAEIARLRLTDAEREAIEVTAAVIERADATRAATLCGLLERTK